MSANFNLFLANIDKPTTSFFPGSNHARPTCIQNLSPSVRNSTNPALDHVMRHCVDRNITSSAPGNLVRKTMIPIRAYDDEEYARGCLQYYNDKFMVKGSLHSLVYDRNLFQQCFG